MTLYLSKLRLSQRPGVAALSALLDPKEAGVRQDANHRLIWSVFAGNPDASRDFLWRAEGRGFIVLSQRPPDQSALFEPIETREFAPDLRAGDSLAFTLRANATRTEKTGGTSANGREKKRHIDLVMDSLPPKGQRSEARMRVAGDVAHKWLEGQGARNGFEAADVICNGYSVVALPAHKHSRKGQPQFGVLDIGGHLTITEPNPFIKKLSMGFGRAKAFGCGLMLIRRA